MPQNFDNPFGIGRFTAEKKLSEVSECPGGFGRDLIKERRREKHTRDLMPCHRLGEVADGEQKLWPKYHEPRAVQERAPNFPRGGIERAIRDLRNGVARLDLAVVDIQRETRDASMRDAHAFGPSS